MSLFGFECTLLSPCSFKPLIACFSHKTRNVLLDIFSLLSEKAINGHIKNVLCGFAWVLRGDISQLLPSARVFQLYSQFFFSRHIPPYLHYWCLLLILHFFPIYAVIPFLQVNSHYVTDDQTGEGRAIHCLCPIELFHLPCWILMIRPSLALISASATPPFRPSGRLPETYQTSFFKTA